MRALARSNVVTAMERLVQLMQSDNPCVAMAAAKVVLERSEGKLPVIHEAGSDVAPPAPGELQVKIMQLPPEGGADAP